MIRMEGIKFRGEHEEILKGIDLTIRDHEVVGIIGPSGSGKSLLLKSILMTKMPDEGRIWLDDLEITAPDVDATAVRKRVGMIFQTFNLFDHYCAVENVMTGLVHLKGMAPMDGFEKAMELLKSVGLADHAFKYPDILSNGQKQRVAIARTIAMDPEVILMDEPTSALDPLMKGEVEAVIRMLKSQGRTMIITSHEMDFIRDVCTRVIFIHDGVVWEEGSARQIFEEAKRPETRRFVKALRTLEFDIKTDTFDFPGMQTALSEYAFRNDIPDNILNRLLSITEELDQMVIIQPKKKNIMKMSFEYERTKGVLTGDVYFSGPPLDPDDPAYFFSWPIIQIRTDEISFTHIDVSGFTNNVQFVLRDKLR